MHILKRELKSDCWQFECKSSFLSLVGTRCEEVCSAQVGEFAFKGQRLRRTQQESHKVQLSSRVLDICDIKLAVWCLMVSRASFGAVFKTTMAE